MRERLVDVVLVVEAQPSHVDGVGVHGVRPQQVVGDLRRIGNSFSLTHRHHMGKSAEPRLREGARGSKDPVDPDSRNLAASFYLVSLLKSQNKPDLLRLFVASEEGEAFCARDFELSAGGCDGERPVEAEERLAIVLGVVGRLELHLEAVQRACVISLL